MCSTKEDLTLPTYSSIFVDSAQKATDALTSGAVSGCNNVSNIVPGLRTNLNSIISSANGQSSTLNTEYSTLNTEKTQLNVQSPITKTAVDKATADIATSMETYNIIKNTLYNVSVQNVFVNSTQSLLNTVLLPNAILEGNQLTTAIASYNSAVQSVNTIIDEYNKMRSDSSTYSVTETQLTGSKTSLNNLINSINANITSNNTATQAAQTSVTNTSNYSNTAAIQKAIGSTYTSAKTNLDNALTAKNNADAAVTQGTANNYSQSQMQPLLTNQQNANENYLQAYETVRFLLDPANLVNDTPNVSDVINLNNNLTQTQVLNTFLNYLKTNNIDVNNSQIFSKLLDNINNTSNSINTLNLNINSVMQDISTSVKKNNYSIAAGALSTCSSTSITLNNLLTTANNNLATINSTLTTIDSNAASVNTYLLTMQNTIQGYVNTMAINNTNLTTMNNYKWTVYMYAPAYNNWDHMDGLPYQIGTVLYTGALTRLYLFVNMTSWYTCLASYSYFTLLLIDGVTGNNIITKQYQINHSIDMTLEYMSGVMSGYNVKAGDIVSIIVVGSYWVTCKVESTNIQVKLDIITG